MKIVTQDSSGACTEDTDDVIAEPITTESLAPVINKTVSTLSPEQMNLMKTFPWMSEFIKLARAEIGVTNLRSLERLMRFYQKQVYQSVKECYSRPNRAAKLKRAMSDALLFFHMTYTELKPPLEHSSYLAKMSDLMAMYLDMEIKASRTGTESLPKIASKLTSSLHVYFGRSHDHILDTILKSKIISKNFWELSDLIFRRVLRDSPGSSLYIISYIRYLLAFKMWKGIMKGAEERKRIAKLAILKLEPPPGFREKLVSGGVLRDLLPRVPKSRPDITTFLMQAKFSVRDKAKLFLKAVADPKLQCALDRQSFGNEMFPNSYEQEESESNILMNDIWSSMMNTESGMQDSLRGIENKKYHKLKNIAKMKTELLKKRRKKIEITINEIGEDDVPGRVLSEVVSNIKSEIVEEEPKVIKEPEKVEVEEVNETDVSMEIAAEVELPPNPPPETEEETPAIKEEPQGSNSKVAAPELAPTWNVTYYNNVEFNYVPAPKEAENVAFTVVEEPCPLPEEQPEVFDPLVKAAIPEETVETEEIAVDDKIEPMNIEVVDASQVEEEQLDVGDQEYKPVDVLSNDGSDGGKTLVREICVSSEYGLEENGIGMLHDYTIKSDSKMYEFQMKVYSYSGRLNARTMLRLLSPVFSEQARLKMYRCWCSGCKNNLCVIRRNWKSVMACIMLNSEKTEDSKDGTDENGYTYEDTLEDLKAIAEGEKGDIMYWEAEIENLLKKIDESVKEDSESSSLPLKKRKAFSYNNYAVDADNKTTPDVSYPCTKMISIAEIELVKEKFRFNAMAENQNASNALPVNYVTNFSTHPTYTPVADPKYNTVIVPAAGKVTVPVDPNLVPGAYTTTFLPTETQEQKIKFKTPAQLKEFQHLSAAQDLINFAHTSRTYCENQDPAPKRQTRQKTKSQSRKRKKRKNNQIMGIHFALLLMANG